MNPAGEWEEVNSQYFIFLKKDYAVYGYVFKNNVGVWNGAYDKPDALDWYWESRTRVDSREEFSAPPFFGYAPTLESAKKIVETLLFETETVERSI